MFNIERNKKEFEVTSKDSESLLVNLSYALLAIYTIDPCKDDFLITRPQWIFLL